MSEQLSTANALRCAFGFIPTPKQWTRTNCVRAYDFLAQHPAAKLALDDAAKVTVGRRESHAFMRRAFETAIAATDQP